MPNPWETEADEANFVAAGFVAAIRRNPFLKTLCGYLAIPAFHPYHGEDDLDPKRFGVPHGRWTYSDDHLPGHAADGNWWIGFDCAHAGDLVPGSLDIGIGLIGQNGIYRDMDYVRAQLIYAARIINGRSDTPDMTRVDFEKLKELFADTPVLSERDWATFTPPLRPTTRTKGRG